MLTLRHILFPTDGSPCAEHAFAHAVHLAGLFQAELHVVYVWQGHGSEPREMLPAPLEVLYARANEVAGGAFAGTIVRAEEREGIPSIGLLAYARRHAVDLVVMGTHGRRGMERLMLGSVAEEVVRLADCPVLTLRPPVDYVPGELRRLLAPVDFSSSSWMAVAYARLLAARTGGRLDLLHVVETLPSYGLVDIPDVFPPPSDEVLASTRQALLDLAAETHGPKVPVEAHVVAGHPVLGVLDAVERMRPDLVVLPSHGRTGLRRLVLGSVAEQVVRRAPSPVLVVRGDGAGLVPDEAMRRADPAPPIHPASPVPRRRVA